MVETGMNGDACVDEFNSPKIVVQKAGIQINTGKNMCSIVFL
jgi:hypothetical protein